jgi:hypothetical protein
MSPQLPKTMFADSKRLQQVLKNLLSNSFKFTPEGHVTFAIEPVKSGWSPQNESLNRASEVIDFAVTDTGIGISPDKQQIIFEAFQQADGSTSRKYGGTGSSPRSVVSWRACSEAIRLSACRPWAARSRCICLLYALPRARREKCGDLCDRLKLAQPTTRVAGHCAAGPAHTAPVFAEHVADKHDADVTARAAASHRRNHPAGR